MGLYYPNLLTLISITMANLCMENMSSCHYLFIIKINNKVPIMTYNQNKHLQRSTNHALVLVYMLSIL